MLLNMVPLWLAVLGLSVTTGTLEASYQQYFQHPFCPKDTPNISEFRSFHEKNLSDHWGFFKFPASDEEIINVDSIQHIPCNGDGILASNFLLSHTLQQVSERLPTDVDDKSRLGFFKMFRNRISARALDGYLHFLRGGWKFTMTVSGSINRANFMELMHGFALFITGDNECSPLFSGLVGSVENEAIKLEIISPPSTPRSKLAGLKEALVKHELWQSLALEVSVSDPSVVDEQPDKVAEVSKLFLADVPVDEKVDEETCQPLTTSWAMLSVRYPLNETVKSYEKLDHFEWVRSLAAPTIVSSMEALHKVLRIHSGAIPGVLSRYSSVAIVKKDYLGDEAAAAFKQGKFGQLNYKVGAMGRFIVPLSGVPSYSGYVEALRLLAEFFTTNAIVSEYVEAVFLHFVGGKTVDASKMEILVWHKQDMPKRAKTELRGAMDDYLVYHQHEMQ